MKKIRIAQIGVSRYSHGMEIFNTLKKFPDLFEIVGYALPENEREKFPGHMDKFAEFREMTVEEILSDPTIDAVTVETEEVYLTKYARMAARAGKHIHMEKPGGAELADFEAMIAAMKESGKVFHTGYMYRYNPYILDLFRAVKAGELGDIVSVEAQMNCIHPLEMRQWLKVMPHGMMFFLGCHLIDLILHIQGMPDEILPMSGTTGVGGDVGFDFGMAALRYGNTWSFAKTSAVERGGFARRQLVVTGTKKTVVLEPLEMYGDTGYPLLFTGRTEYTDEGWGDRGTYTESAYYDRYESMMQTFAAMCRGEVANPHTYDYELELYRTVLKACGVK